MRRKARLFTRPVVPSLRINKNQLTSQSSNPKSVRHRPRQPAPVKSLETLYEFPVSSPRESAHVIYRRKHAPNVNILLGEEKPKRCSRLSTLKRRAESGNFFDSICPICHEILGRSNIVMLSCGHIVHHVCLNSFRRLTHRFQPRCPECHCLYTIVDIRVDYEKLDEAAVKIQRVFRGYKLRKELLDTLPQDSLIRRYHVIKQAENASNLLTNAIEHHNDAVDAIINSIDHELEWARSVMRAVEARGRLVDWDDVKQKARARSNWTCTICLREIPEDECAVTSCGHCFHNTCLSSWMQFCSSNDTQTSCPECRSFFQHRPLNEHLEEFEEYDNFVIA